MGARQREVAARPVNETRVGKTSWPGEHGLDTIYKSRGNISEEFPRDCGLPESFITYMRSLTGEAVEFYSCFINYSHKDEEFVQRLYSRMRGRGCVYGSLRKI